MRILGVDPGAKGGWALLEEDGSLVRAGRTPVTGDEYDLPAMCKLMDDERPTHVALELVRCMNIHGRPQGGSSMFTFGMGYGLWKGMIAMAALPRIDVTPQEWSKLLGGMPRTKALDKDATSDARQKRMAEAALQRKANAVNRARALWPTIPIKFKADWAMADAALIAEAARRQLCGVKVST